MIVPGTLPAGRQEWRDTQGKAGPGKSLAAVPPMRGHQVLIRVADEDGRPVAGAEVSALSDHDLHDDCAVTDAQGHAVLTVAESGTGALLVEASGFAPLLLPGPAIVPLLPAGPVANTVTLQPFLGRGAGSVVDAPCWGVAAMQIDHATLPMPLGTRRACVGILGAAEPAAASGTISPDMQAMGQVIDRICADTDTVFQVLPAFPTLSQTLRGLADLAEAGADLILLGVLPPEISPALEACIGQLRQDGILVLSPAPESCHGAGCWSRTAPVLCVGSLRRKLRDIGPCACPATARIDLLAPGAGIRIGASLRSGTMLAAAHAAGFLVCLMQAEGLLVGRRQGTAADTLLHRLDRWIRPMAAGAGMPVWGGQDFYEIVV